jgi:hypothetical protein
MSYHRHARSVQCPLCLILLPLDGGSEREAPRTSPHAERFQSKARGLFGTNVTRCDLRAPNCSRQGMLLTRNAAFGRSGGNCKAVRRAAKQQCANLAHSYPKWEMLAVIQTGKFHEIDTLTNTLPLIQVTLVSAPDRDLQAMSLCAICVTRLCGAGYPRTARFRFTANNTARSTELPLATDSNHAPIAVRQVKNMRLKI